MSLRWMMNLFSLKKLSYSIFMQQLGLQKKWFIKSLNEKIDKLYTFSKKPIGEGSFGSVFSATHLSTKITRAIKVITKSKVKNQQRLVNQIQVMRQLDHPNIIRLYQTFQDQKNLYIVMEKCDGGELFDYLVEKDSLTEEEARLIFIQMAQAIAYCHKHNICHRDLKPQNFLLLHKNNINTVKVIDFGLSSIMFDQSLVVKKNFMKTKAGTPFYISPQVLEGKYDQSCDVWSLGVILYVMLSGQPPFFGDTEKEVLQKVRSRKFSLSRNVSRSALNLISLCLTNVQHRIRSSDILRHDWINLSGDIEGFRFSRLQKFGDFSVFKKLVRGFIACQFSEADFGKLGEYFKAFDKNGDGYIEISELKEVTNKIGKSSSLQKTLEQLKSVKGWKLNYTQFLAICLDQKVYQNDEKLQRVFNLLTGGKNINKQTLKRMLGENDGMKGKPQQFWEKIIADADINGDGEVDLQEFKLMLLKEPGH